MSSSRFILNRLPDYDGQDYLSQVDRTSLREDILQSIRSHLSRLFQYWENNLNQIELNDTSVYTGLTGAAILYLKIYESNLFAESNCLQKCFNVISKTLESFRRIKVPTFMCGEVGLLTVAALVKNKLGQDCKEHLSSIASVHNSLCNINSDVPDEILYGRAGYLYSLLLLRSQIANCTDIITDHLIRSVITAILNSGIQTSKRTKIDSPLAYFWYNEPYVGAAHGYAGIAYLLLEASPFLTEHELNSLVKPTIDFICSLQYPNSANFPPCIGDKDDKLIHWCHGSPGVIHLLVLAYKKFADPKYLQIASAASDDIWKRGLLRKGTSVR